MTDLALPAAGFADRAFRIGTALNKALAVLSRNLLPFCIVSGIAALPNLLWSNDAINTSEELFWSAVGVALSLAFGEPSRDLLWSAAGVLLAIVLGALCQAIMLYGALEHMRGRPVSLRASFQVAWRRFLPVIAVGICVALMVGLGYLLLIIPGFMLLTMWYVATPACVVEQLGPRQSLRRSAALTRGHRWQIFGMMVLVGFVGSVGSGLVEAIARGGGPQVLLVAKLAFTALYGAFSAILAVVTYHDLRLAKEGGDTDHIVAVFD